MAKHGKEYEDVLHMIQSKRAIAQPNKGFEKAFITSISEEIQSEKIKKRHEELKDLTHLF